MMVKDWLLLGALTLLGLILLVVLVDHIVTEIEWYRWNKKQNK